MIRAKEFLKLIKADIILVSIGTCWKEFSSLAEIKLGKEKLFVEEAHLKSYPPKWEDVRIFLNSEFNGRPVTVMKIPQPTGRGEQGIIIKAYPQLFEEIGNFIKEIKNKSQPKNQLC